MIENLEQFGLSEKEAKVYLASLELGKATADQLAKHSKVNRSTTYVQLESLMQMGLMSTHEEGKKTFFTAESPDNLRRVLAREKKRLELREDELSRSLPDLVRMFESAGERPIVRFYEGKEGITAMRERALEEVRGKEFKVLYSHDHLAKLYSEEERDAYSKKRHEKNIKLQSIFVSNQDVPLGPARPLADFRLLPQREINLSTDFLIYDDKVGISSLEGSPFGILIQSEKVAQSFTGIFKFFWSKAREL